MIGDWLTARAAHIAAIGIALTVSSGADAQTAPGAKLGQVRAVYVQISRFLLAAPGLHNQTTGRPLIADVRFASPLADGRAGTLARIEMEDGASLEAGDVVEIALTATKGGRMAAAPMPRMDGVLRIEAKHDTDIARTFGAPAVDVAAATPVADWLSTRSSVLRNSTAGYGFPAARPALASAIAR